MLGRAHRHRVDVALHARPKTSEQLRGRESHLAAPTFLEHEAHEHDRERFRGLILERAGEQELRHLQLVPVDLLRDLPARRQHVALEVSGLVEEREVPVQDPPLFLAVPLLLLLRARPMLELVERFLPGLVHARPPEALDEVQERAERQAESAPHRLGLSEEQPLHRRFREILRREQRDHEALVVLPLASRAARHLQVVARLHVVERHAVELAQAREHRRPRGHVDPERERLGREEELQEPRREHPLDELLVDREHPGVVVRDPAPRHRHHFAVLLARVELIETDQLLLQLHHPPPFVLVEQLAALVVPREALAVLPAEREHERGQEPVPLEPVDERRGVRGSDERLEAPAPTAPPVAPAGPPAAVLVLAQSLAPARRPRTPGSLELALAHALDHLQVERPAPRRVQPVVQGNGTPGGLDHLHVLSADLGEPRAELLHVRDRRRKADEADVLRREDQALLPHRSALEVVHVVDLVEHDVLDFGQVLGVLEDRVAQDLRGHDQDPRGRMDRDVPGHDPDVDRRIVAEVPVLLVAQRLDRRRVDAAPALQDRVRDRVLGDERLPRPRGRADEHVAPAADRVDRSDLEGVELVALPVQDLSVHDGSSAGCGVAEMGSGGGGSGARIVHVRGPNGIEKSSTEG